MRIGVSGRISDNREAIRLIESYLMSMIVYEHCI